MTFFDRTGLIGSRGTRRSPGVRFVPAPSPEAARPPAIVAPLAPRPRSWTDTVRALLHLRPVPSGPVARDVAEPPSPRPEPASAPIVETSLDHGIRDIRRTDPGFDPGRFVGYIGMIFRSAQHAWTAGDFASLRDRVTPEMYGEMQAHCDRSRSAGRVNRVAEIDITAKVTEAWQESGRDYVTADIAGFLVDYTVEAPGDRLVAGSKTVPRAVQEFWTFTRPRGLNAWMLSAIQS